MILIVGAGLAGLSTAYHLRGVPYKVLEREREVGGLCRSYAKDGFTFDYTGHLLHFRQTAIKALVESLLPTQLQRHARKSYVFSHDTYTEYPFQVNTHGLPLEVVREAAEATRRLVWRARRCMGLVIRVFWSISTSLCRPTPFPDRHCILVP